MRKMLMVAAALGGCATSYESSYRDSQLGPQMFEVYVRVNGYTDAGRATEYAYKRANELCPNGFDVVDRARGDNGYTVANGTSQAFAQRTGNTVTAEGHNTTAIETISKPEVTLVVKCGSAPVESAPVEVVHRPAGGYWWCAAPRDDDGVIVGCADSEDACATVARVGSDGVAEKCTAQQNPICFIAGSVGNQQPFCYAAPEPCLEMRELALKKGWPSSPSECKKQ